MNYTFSLCPECTAKFGALRLDAAAQQDSNQIPFNSIVWTDEYLPPGQMPFRVDHPICLDSLIRLFYARKRLWQTGQIPHDLAELWRQAHETLPEWPGFQRLRLAREDFEALNFCEEETDDMVGSLRQDAAIFALTDQGGGVVSFVAHPPKNRP